jgi:hypothetical protein
VQPKTLLATSGVVLSSMGGQVPLAAMLEMAQSAGYVTEVLTYMWKIESEPEEAIRGYKKVQEEGVRPVGSHCSSNIINLVNWSYSSTSILWRY